MTTRAAIAAREADIGNGLMMAGSARIVANRVVIGNDVTLEEGVEISADSVEIGHGCRIGPRSRIVSSTVVVGAGTVMGADVTVEANEEFRVGPFSQVGQRLRIVAQAMTCGERLWMTDDVIVGGGGARTDRAVLRLGDRVAIMDRCFLNVCREISIGDDTALSNGVVLLTHSTWHPALDGGSPVFGPIRIGRDVIIFVDAVVAPGVSLGDHVTVAANALVLADVPDSSLAMGNPARAIRLVPSYPRVLPHDRQDELVRAMLVDYSTELPVKGVHAVLAGRDVMQIAAPEGSATLRYLPSADPAESVSDAAITLSCRPTTERERGTCHFDLTGRVMYGVATVLSEDFRDFLRRRTVRIYTDRPFQSLMPANIVRLTARLQQT